MIWLRKQLDSPVQESKISYVLLLSVVALSMMLIALVWQMTWVPWRGFSYNAMFWMFLGLIDACDRMRLTLPAPPAAPGSDTQRSLRTRPVP